MSEANLNVHLHCLVLDGVCRSDGEGVAEFIEAAAPTDEALDALLHTVIERLMKALTACTRRCASKPASAGGWSGCAATSSGRRSRTSVSR
jgi:hypothetical protein